MRMTLLDTTRIDGAKVMIFITQSVAFRSILISIILLKKFKDAKPMNHFTFNFENKLESFDIKPSQIEVLI